MDFGFDCARSKPSKSRVRKVDSTRSHQFIDTVLRGSGTRRRTQKPLFVFRNTLRFRAVPTHPSNNFTARTAVSFALFALNPKLHQATKFTFLREISQYRESRKLLKGSRVRDCVKPRLSELEIKHREQSFEACECGWTIEQTLFLECADVQCDRDRIHVDAVWNGI